MMRGCFGDVLKLDEIISPQGDFFERASRLYNISVQKIDLEKDFGLLRNGIVKAYELCRDESFRLASLESIYDIVCVELLFLPSGRLCEHSDVSSAIEILQSKSNGGIRFHVNDWGVKSYLVISREYEERLKKVRE